MVNRNNITVSKNVYIISYLSCLQYCVKNLCKRAHMLLAISKDILKMKPFEIESFGKIIWKIRS